MAANDKDTASNNNENDNIVNNNVTLIIKLKLGDNNGKNINKDNENKSMKKLRNGNSC